MILFYFSLLAVCVHASTPWYSQTCDDGRNYTGTYLIVAPQTIRPDAPFTATISLLPDFPYDSATVRVGICRSSSQISLPRCLTDYDDCVEPLTVTNEAPDLTLVETEVVVQKNSTKPTEATVQAPKKLPEYNYDLCVNIRSASNEVEITDSTGLYVNQRTLSVFIQTDKAKYNPGNTVNYRVAVVDPNLKPYKGNLDIKITDPKKNIIQLKKNIKLDQGVTTQKLELSAEPPLGAWTIAVKVGEYDETKSFSIEKYVLPKFEVKLDYDTAAQVDEDFEVTVEGIYTYGKPLKGKAKLFVEGALPYWWSGEHERQAQPVIMLKDLDDDGKATFELSYATFANQSLFVEYYSRSLKLTGSVTEELTGITRNISLPIMFYDYKYQINIEAASQSFKPGLGLPLTATVTYPDGKQASLPPDERRRTGVFRTTYTRRDHYDPQTSDNEDVVVNTTIIFGADGFYSMILKDIPANTLSIYGTILMINDKQFGGYGNYLNLQVMKSPAKSYVQITNKNTAKAYNVGDTAKFSVKLTKTPVILAYQVMAKGITVTSSDVSLDTIVDGQFDLDFPIGHSMTPSGRLVVYGVMASGDTNSEVIADAMNFDVKGLLQNNVSLSFKPIETEPYTGEVKNQVELKIGADPNSFVGILAVDKSVKLLGTDNDITISAVEEAGGLYDSLNYGSYYGPIGRWKRDTRSSRTKRFSYFWWGYIGGADVNEIFSNAGITVLTDGYMSCGYYGCYDYYGCDYEYYDYDDSDEDRDKSREDLSSPKSNREDELPAPVTVASAAGKAGGAPAPANKVVVREEFPETWLWLDLTMSSNGSTTYKTTVPDTITTWIASAFAMNDKTGMGVANEASLRVFRPFFVSLNLPYSVKRGEQLALQVLVFNYNDKDELVRVELDHNAKSGFHFVSKTGGAPKTKSVAQNIRYVAVPSQDSATVFFPIVANVLGELPLIIKAYGSAATDGVKRKLRVEPEGVPLFFNKPVLIDLSQSNTFETEIRITDAPSNLVQGSAKSEFSVVGDLMGPVLSNIEHLVRMPYGCGEQNMVNFVPNIVVLDYLTSAGKLTDAIKEKAIRFMQAGYQRELNYKRSDNSFSAFGQGDAAGSTWLTAFVVWAFAKAKPYIEIEQSILEKSITFLEKQQNKMGAFDENGEVHSKHLQGGAGDSKIALTAYVVLALVENGIVNDRAIEFLENKLNSIQSNPFVLSIVSYAFQKADSERKDDALNLLEKLVIAKDATKHWQDEPEAKDPEKPWWYYSAPPANIEMTSYGLLSYTTRDQVLNAFPIVRWLVNQRNDYGGFGSTQDTVIGIHALAAYASRIAVAATDLTVTVEQGSTKQSIAVNAENSLVLQQAPLEGIDTPIKISAKGTGKGFAQVSYRYNVEGLDDTSPFTCRDTVHQSSPGELILEVCCSYALKGRSNMALLEAETLSGFTIDVEKLDDLTAIPDLQRVETSKEDTKAAIYFNSIGTNDVCLNITQLQDFQVAKQRPSMVKLRDYYAPNLNVDFAYDLTKKKTLSDQCPDCWPFNESTEQCNDEYDQCASWLKAMPDVCGLLNKGCRKTCKQC